MTLSIVSPVYQAESIIPILIERIEKSVQSITPDYEIILVDDRSPDNSWKVIETLSKGNAHLKGIRLSRNFGQHPAIMAGLTQAQGDWVVVVDCDLQDQPEEIAKLYNKALEGYDVVFAKRNNRKDSFLKKASSKLFSIIFNYLAGIKADNGIANFGIYHNKVIASVLSMGDYIKSFPLFVYFSGYNSTIVLVEHAARHSGKTSYSPGKLFSFAYNTILSYSNKPLKLFVRFGLTISFISMCLGIYTIYKYLNGEVGVMGYTSLMVSIWFLSGIVITVIGVVGIYVGKVFEQTKNRPPFIIDKKNNTLKK
ncbi:glycosyltransferase family 2 protein [Aestuariivivens sediminis]|uniref:glycosyltransferase family 2 protein n=1 Tax=Aestuariivivens sediminis TaxID=2913557 RepID=UPI001F589EF2|nr:glycosyltransferase family 2 protein [Aestuariivivens sediminis]